LSKLKSLNIKILNDITDEGLRVLANGNLSKLTSLDLTGCYNNLTDAGLALLSSGNLSSLLSLNLSICSGFTDGGYAALATGNLQQLESLHLWTTEITEVGLAALANGNLSNLKLLDLSCNDNLTDAGLLALADGKLSNLQSLKLFRCLGVTDAGIQAVVRASTKLKSLNMDHCNVTDAWLPQEECDTLTHLEDVSVEFCDNISDEGVAAIATRLCNLRSLNVSWCRNVSDASLVPISKVPSLKKLIIGGEYTKITASGVDLFRNRDIIEYR
jgi:F-box/leucine-rich repeat protein 2/20